MLKCSSCWHVFAQTSFHTCKCNEWHLDCFRCRLLHKRPSAWFRSGSMSRNPSKKNMERLTPTGKSCAAGTVEERSCLLWVWMVRYEWNLYEFVLYGIPSFVHSPARFSEVPNRGASFWYYVFRHVYLSNLFHLEIEVSRNEIICYRSYQTPVFVLKCNVSIL